MTIPPEVLRALVDAGATTDMILAAVQADHELEEAKLLEKRKKNAERQRRYRNSMSRDVTATSVTNGDISPDKESPPDPQKKLTPPKKKNPPTGVKKKKGSRLPSDWTLSAEDRQYAVSKGLRSIDIETEKFRNYWLAKTENATKLDWGRTWQNWVINAVQRQATGPPDRQSRWAEAIAETRGDLGL